MGNVMGGIGRGIAGQRGKKWRVRGRWCQGQTGKSIGYKVILAAGVDNGEAR